MSSTYVDEHFLPVMDLNLVAGENFHQQDEQASTEYLILNEAAVKQYQLGSPAEAIGQQFWINDNLPATIIGVVEDFHYRTFEYGIEPVVLRYSNIRYSQFLQVRLNPGDPKMALASLASIWKSIDPIHLFEPVFMDDSIRKSYQHFTILGGLTSFFALLSMVLAAMGLLGMVTYTVNTRIKEIGIRKVLGATTAGLMLLLSRQFLLLIGVATLIALPIGYLLSNRFLQIFAYRISMSGFIFVLGISLMVVTVLLTVGIQAFRAALANPVDSLRNE